MLMLRQHGAPAKLDEFVSAIKSVWRRFAHVWRDANIGRRVFGAHARQVQLEDVGGGERRFEQQGF